MTLGKRIAQNRKRLGLTQDALAEQLGVTAQAVSKWENDQSCPDIATLPKLADLFGVSVDELLGREQRVHTAELVTEEEPDEEYDGEHKTGAGWEFHWDAGRKSALGFAVFVLMVGGVMLAAKFMNLELGLWDAMWPCALFVFGLWGLIPKFSFFSMGALLLGGYFLADRFDLIPFTLGKDILLPALIILFGVSLLADALRKPKRSRFSFNRKGSADRKTKKHFSVDAESFECELSFGEHTHLITMPRLSEGEISCSFGELTVDLSGCEHVSESCTVDASCSFGELRILVPRRFRIIPEISTTFGDLNMEGQSDPSAEGAIRLCGDANFGQIKIQYI